MFDRQRYLTHGINTILPPELVLFLWQLIDASKNVGHELDYLQVFNLSSTTNEQGQLLQKVEHSQEVPPYQTSYSVQVMGEPIHAKVFVIDDTSHSTMLLAEEY